MSLLKKRTSRSGGKSRSSQQSSIQKRSLKKTAKPSLIKKPFLNSQQVLKDPLALKPLDEPKMVKISSEVKKIDYSKKKAVAEPALDLKNGKKVYAGFIMFGLG